MPLAKTSNTFGLQRHGPHLLGLGHGAVEEEDSVTEFTGAIEDERIAAVSIGPHDTEWRDAVATRRPGKLHKSPWHGPAIEPGSTGDRDRRRRDGHVRRAAGHDVEGLRAAAALRALEGNHVRSRRQR